MFHNESSPGLTSTGLCSPMGIGQTLLNMREELSVFYIPKTISRLQNETERQETQAAQRPAALTASIFFGSRGFRKPNCPQPGSDAVFFTPTAGLTDISRGAWLAIQGATDHSNMKWELISNVQHLIISIKCRESKDWQRREGILFPHRMTLQQGELTPAGRSPGAAARPLWSSLQGVLWDVLCPLKILMLKP